MNRTNTRICWLRKPLHIANTGGHFFSFLSLIHIFSCTQRLITLSTPSWAQCHVLDLHSTPCTLHSHTQSKRRKKQRGHHSFKTFFLWFTSYQFPGFLFALCESCIFSVPGFHVKRSWHATVPDHLERSITQPCQLHPFKYSSFGSL